MSTSIIRVQILFLCLAMISCQKVKKLDEDQIKRFDLKELPKIREVKLSNLGIIDIEYIPLETNEKCLLPMINDIIFADDYFLIHFYSNVLMFRNDGKFVTKIGIEGRGPNEFTVVHDVDINRKNQNIYLADGWQKKFYVFSKNGDFIKTVPIATSSEISFRFTDFGILSYNTNSFGNIENSYQLIDTTGRIIKNFPNKYSWHKLQNSTALFDENLFYYFNGKLFKKEIYSDTIYVFENLDFKPHLIIEHGEKLLTTAARSNYEHSILFEKFISQKRLFEFGDYIYYEFMYNIKRGSKNFLRRFIASKKDNSQFLINTEHGIINDLDGGPNVWPKTIKDNYTLVSWIEALELKKLVSSQSFKNSTPKYPKKKDELERLANSLKHTDNPVLIIARLKK